MNAQKYSLIADASFPLFFYLLYASEEMLDNTSFYVGGNLQSCHLSNKVFVPKPKYYTKWGLIRYRLSCLKYRPQLKKTKIIAQDHLYFSAPLIDNLPYTVIEDCPGFFTVLHTRHYHPYQPKGFKEKIYFRLIGRIYNRYAGYNPYCQNRIVSTERDHQLFDSLHLPNECYDLQQLWDDASESRKERIIEVFNLRNLSQIANRSVIIFSQPFMQDCHYSEQEVIDLFRPFIEKYGAEDILVKLHPRDTFDYKKAFPGIETLITKAPQQFLTLMGLKFKTAITVCSSAVSSMDANTEIIWLGAEIDPRIVKAYGVIKCPVNLK